MKFVTAVIAVVLALSASKVSLAEDYISDTVQALQQAPVYVAPGTEDTDKDTAARLQARLSSGDTIVLVMLPASAEISLGEDISATAVRLSEALGNQRIIGLAVGKKAVGYAPTLPSGVAADLMRRANSVSNDPVTALNTFGQNVHRWQADNPQPKPPPPPTTGNGEVPWPAGALVIVATSGIMLLWQRRKAVHASQRTHFKVPNQIKDQLSKIAQERGQVLDAELRGVLYQLCLDIERYFQSSSSDREGDASFMQARLTEVIAVQAKYVDVQRHSRYYNRPDAWMDQGKEAISDFGQYVLEAIRNGNDAALTDFRVANNILQAQRLASNPEEDFDRRLGSSNER